MREKIQIYLWGAGTGTVAEVIQKITGFVSVWILNQTLVKGQYGDYEFALAAVSMAVILGSGGLQNVAMYRLSRLEAPPKKLAGEDLAGSLLGLSLLIAALIAFLLVAALPIITSVAGKSSLRFWIGGLVLLIPLRVAKGIFSNWYEARQLIAESIIYSKIAPATAKVILLFFTWVLWPTPLGVVVAILLSEMCPLTAWYVRTPVNAFPKPRLLSWWDITYASKLIVTRSLSKTNKRSDILMMGALGTSVATAEYVIASKISMIILASHKIVNKILRPRVGRLISGDKWVATEKEYHETRLISLAYSFMYAAIISYIGVYILGIFGEYQSAYTATMVLIATYIVTVSFGMNGEYLNIAGYAGWSLAITLLTLCINLSLNYFLIPIYSEVGAAFAMFTSIVVTNAICSVVIYKIDGLRVYSVRVMTYTVIGVSLVCMAGFAAISKETAAFMLLSMSVVIIVNNRRVLKKIARELV